MTGPADYDRNDHEARQDFEGDCEDDRELDEIFSDDPEERRRRIALREAEDFDPERA